MDTIHTTLYQEIYLYRYRYIERDGDKTHITMLCWEFNTWQWGKLVHSGIRSPEFKSQCLLNDLGQVTELFWALVSPNIKQTKTSSCHKLLWRLDFKSECGRSFVRSFIDVSDSYHWSRALALFQPPDKNLCIFCYTHHIPLPDEDLCFWLVQVTAGDVLDFCNLFNEWDRSVF